MMDVGKGIPAMEMYAKAGAFPVRDAFIVEDFKETGSREPQSDWVWDPIRKEFRNPAGSYVDDVVAACLKSDYARGEGRDNSNYLRMNFPGGYGKFSAVLLR